MLHLGTRSAPARWVWGEERQTAPTSLRGPEHPSPQTARAVGQPRDTAGEGHPLGKKLKPQAPIGDPSGCLAAPRHSTAAVEHLRSHRASCKVIFFKSGWDWHSHSSESSFLILLYMASKILSKPHPSSHWFHWYSLNWIFQWH